MCTDSFQYEVVVVKNTFVDVETVPGADTPRRRKTLPHSFALSPKLLELLDELNAEDDGFDDDFSHFTKVGKVSSEDLSEVSTEVRSEPSDASDGDSDGESDDDDDDEEFGFGHARAVAEPSLVHTLPQVIVTLVEDSDLVQTPTPNDTRPQSSASKATALASREVAQYMEVFEYLDKDGDGFITAGELGCMLSPFAGRATDAELQDLVNDVDLASNGKIDFADFLTWLSSNGVCDDGELVEAFNLFDHDQDGLIDAAGLQQTLASLGECITVSEASLAISAFDGDGDGHINFCEFVAMMMEN